MLMRKTDGIEGGPRSDWEVCVERLYNVPDVMRDVLEPLAGLLGAARLCLRALELKNGQQWTKEDAKSHLRLSVSRVSLVCLSWLLVFQSIPKSVLKMV